MSMTPLKIIFQLDGSGIYYDPNEPLMLDGVLAAACVRWHFHGEPPARDEACEDVPLPLTRWHLGGTWGWKASALFPEGNQAEDLQFWRKRFRQNRMELTAGSPNLRNGIYRDWNMPLPLLLVPRMVAYTVGDARQVRRELKRSIRWLGKKRAQGRGRVVDIEVERMEMDWSMWREGTVMRWLPAATGQRLVRVRPPYWNTTERVTCREIGEVVA